MLVEAIQKAVGGGFGITICPHNGKVSTISIIVYALKSREGAISTGVYNDCDLTIASERKDVAEKMIGGAIIMLTVGLESKLADI